MKTKRILNLFHSINGEPGVCSIFRYFEKCCHFYRAILTQMDSGGQNQQKKLGYKDVNRKCFGKITKIM